MGRGIVFFFLISVVLTFFVEWLSINFGVPFGHYHYTEKLGSLILGVPWVIPFQWFNVLYPSYFLACILFPTDTMVQRTSTSVFDMRLIVRGIGSAAMMVGWDLINDSLMANVVGMWIWENPTEFFGLMFDGIPLSNYIGWAITVFAVVSLYEMFRHKMNLPVNWINDNPIEPANILVLVPYSFNYMIQLVQALGLGTLSSTIVVPSYVILAASISLFIVIMVTLLAYINVRTL